MPFAMKATGSGSDFAPHPSGTCAAVCTRIVDLGTQPGGQYDPRRKVMVSWESQETMQDGRPFLLNKFYTRSFHEKSRLRQDMEAWRGRAYKDGEEVDIAKTLGAGALLNVKENARGYADIVSVSPLPKGMQAPEPVGDLIVFNLDSPDWDAFESLSDRLKEMIQQSPEYHEAMGGPKTTAPAAEAPQPSQDFDDEIPF